MNRSVWLAAIAVVLAPVPGFAQFGGMGGGLRAVGAFGGEAQAEAQRFAEVELEGGQRVSGEIGLRPLTVDGDIGRYSIAPDKIKVIRFLKPPDEVGAGNAEDAGAVPKGAPMRRANRNNAMGFVNDPLNQGAVSSLARGKVITTPGKEIIGNIYIPTDFKIAIDVGTLYLAAGKLRTITFTEPKAEEGRANEPARPAAAGAPAQAGRPEAAEVERSPSYFRQGDHLIVFMPGGNRVGFYNIETRTSQTIELSASKDAPVEVTPILGPNIMALALNGPKITRIAVADLASGTWHPQDLRQPVEGRASPIVGPGVAVYTLGRHVYAYSAPAHRWDIAELPEGVGATPVVGSDGASIQGRGHIYLFSAKTGKWEHIDVRAILDDAGAEKK